ncbi:uncharacterized protein [Miscanthus floridulus]|uniref:uncharacterized protein isoform X1 n=1 Tax=Miscanthus floridulus TaxID=154761 RepID=UPI0034594331
MAPTADTPCGAGDPDPLGVESLIVVTPPDPNMSRGTSSRRPLWSRRGFDISPVPSPLIRSKQGERYRDHQHHRAPDENIRSPRFYSPLRRSKSVPFPKRFRLEDGRKGSSSGGHCYNDEEGSGSRGRYDDGQHTQELGYPTNCDHGHLCLGGSKRNSSPHCRGKGSLSVQRYPSPRGKSPLPMPMKMSLWDDGSSPTYFCGDEQYTQRNSSPNDNGKRSVSVQQQSSPSGKPPLPMPMEMSPWSPTSSTYRCEDEQYIQSGSHDDDQGGTSGITSQLDLDCRGSTSGCYDDSRIVGRSGVVGRESSFTEKEDFAYDALVDDFMAAVSKSWYNPVPNKTVDKEARQKQTNRFAELALKRYNKNRNNKVKYALVEATVGGAIFEDSELYAHVNFYAKAKNGPKKNSGKVLVFAELHHIGRRQNAKVLTCFCFLDENNQFGGRRDQVQRPIIAQDIHHCYACSDRIKHPDGSCYKAGHVVDMLCYHYN